MVGDDVTIRIDDHARTESLSLLLGRWLCLPFAKELAKEWIVHERKLLRLAHASLGMNRHDCRRCFAYDIGVRNSSHGAAARSATRRSRSEEHTSELQSQSNLVCRLLLEKKKHIHTLFFHSYDTTTTEIYTLSLHDALPI